MGGGYLGESRSGAGGYGSRRTGARAWRGSPWPAEENAAAGRRAAARRRLIWGQDRNGWPAPGSTAQPGTGRAIVPADGRSAGGLLLSRPDRAAGAAGVDHRG